jgi:hypothetical protein
MSWSRARTSKARKTIFVVICIVIVRLIGYQFFGGISHNLATDRKYHDTPNPGDARKNYGKTVSYQSISKTNGGSSHFRDKTNPFRERSGFQKRGTPFVQGYKPTGGDLPFDPADFLASERMWKYVSDTCLLNDESDNETATTMIPEWQRRAPYAILLGAMKVRKYAVLD